MSQINKLKGACTLVCKHKGNTNGGKLMTYMRLILPLVTKLPLARPMAENSGYLTVFGAAKLH